MFKRKSLVKIEFPDLFTDGYKEIADVSEFVEDKYVSDKVRLTLACLGYNGVFLFFSSAYSEGEKEKALKDIDEFNRKQNLYINGIYSFVRFLEEDYFIAEGKLVSMSELGDDLEMLDRFKILYDNTLRPAIDLGYIGFSSDLDRLFEPEIPKEYLDDNGEAIAEVGGDEPYVQKVLNDSALEIIVGKLEALPEEKRGRISEYVDENGIKYRRGAVKTKLFGYSTRDAWYPVADENPLSFLILTVLGGWFGLHKYRTGEIGQGLLYTLTCGGFGIFYIFDVLSICMGTYYVTQTDYSETASEGIERSKVRIYLDKLPRISYGIAGLILSIAIAFGSYQCVYMKGLEKISNVVAGSVSSQTEDYAGSLF